MLFVVCGADCDHVGDIYECPQGTYAIGRHWTSSSTTKQFHIHKNTNNKDICNTNNKLFMILYNCNFMMYCMRFHTGFLFGKEGGWGSECTSPGPASSPSSMEDSAPVALSASSSQSLFTIPLHNRVGDCIHIWS